MADHNAVTVSGVDYCARAAVAAVAAPEQMRLVTLQRAINNPSANE